MPTTHLLFDEYLTPTAPPEGPPAVDATVDATARSAPLDDAGAPPPDDTASVELAAAQGEPELAATQAEPELAATQAEPELPPAPSPPAPFPPAPVRTDDGDAHRSTRTGRSVRGSFLAFWANYGSTLCGEPLTDEVLIDGRRAQVFERLVLHEVEPGRVQPMDVGTHWLDAIALGQQGRSAHALSGLVISDRTAEMAALATADAHAQPAVAAYPRRTLSDIRYIVVHQSGASPAIGPDAIAREHGQTMGWPGIGYHYVVDTDGGVHQTQDLTVASHHARQFNPVAVGVAMCGNFDTSPPPAGQLDRTAALIAYLIDQLGLPLDAVRGHGELVPTGCPGLTFALGWRATLLEAVAGHAGRTALRAEVRAIVPGSGAVRAGDRVAANALAERAGADAP